MGGKSRKSGGVSKELVAKLMAQKAAKGLSIKAEDKDTKFGGPKGLGVDNE